MSQDVKYLIFIQRKRFSCCLIALPEWGRCPGRGLAWVSRPPGNKPGSHEAAGAWTRTAPSPLVRAPPPVLHRSPSRPRPSTSPRSEVRRILIDKNLRGTNNQWLSDSSRGPPATSHRALSIYAAGCGVVENCHFLDISWRNLRWLTTGQQRGHRRGSRQQEHTI